MTDSEDDGDNDDNHQYYNENNIDVTINYDNDYSSSQAIPLTILKTYRFFYTIDQQSKKIIRWKCERTGNKME